MNIEICMTLTGSAAVLFYLLLKPLKGKYIEAEYFQCVLRAASVLYILPFQMMKYPVRKMLKLLNLADTDTGVYHYKNLEYKYINKAFYYSETFRRKAELFIWVIAAGILLLAVIYRHIKFRKAANLMEPISDPGIIQTVSEVMKQVGVDRKVSVFYNDRIKGTFVAGIFRPIIIIRKDDMLSDNLEIIMKHELTHVKNLDGLFQILALLTVAANWYNPLAYYLFFEEQNLDEQVCDSKVIDGMDKDERDAYGELIVERAVKEDRKAKIMISGFSSSSKVLEERIRLIMNYKRSDKKSKVRAIIFMLTASVCVFSAASFSVLAYEEPSEVSVSFTEPYEVADAVFATENAEDSYFDIGDDAFESSDKIFIDENGNIYSIDDNTESRRGCSHDWQSGTYADHSKSGGGCTVRVYNAQRCSKCGDIIVGSLISTHTFTTCPH